MLGPCNFLCKMAHFSSDERTQIRPTLSRELKQKEELLLDKRIANGTVARGICI